MRGVLDTAKRADLVLHVVRACVLRLGLRVIAILASSGVTKSRAINTRVVLYRVVQKKVN